MSATLLTFLVEETPEPLICSYPRLAVETPNEVFDNGDFQFRLTNYLSRPNTVDSDHLLPLPIHPQYINALFNGILKSVGQAVDVPHVPKHTALLTSTLNGAHCITKHIPDHIDCVFTSEYDWRHSPLWLLIGS